MTGTSKTHSIGAGWHGFLTIGHVQLEAHFIGAAVADAPTIVFLHEGLGTAGLWRDLPERVAAATGCGVLVYSRHGYGGSTRKPHPWSRTYLHDEAQHWLPKVLDAAGVRRAVLVGHSDGGSIATIAAASGVVRALEGVVLLAPHVMVEPEVMSGVNGAIDAYERGRLRTQLSRHHHHVEDAFWGWAKAWTDFGRSGWDVRPLLPRIAVPVMVVQGDQDEFGSAEQYEAIRDGVSGPVEVRVVPGARHQIIRDAPDEVVAAVVDLVSGLYRAAAA